MNLVDLMDFYIKLSLKENSVEEQYSKHLDNSLKYINSQIEDILHISAKPELAGFKNALEKRIAFLTKAAEIAKTEEQQFELNYRADFYTYFLNEVEKKLNSSKNF